MPIRFFQTTAACCILLTCMVLVPDRGTTKVIHAQEITVQHESAGLFPFSKKGKQGPRDDLRVRDKIAEPKRVIVVDPGHGGIDGGTSGQGFLEKNLTLDTAHRIKTFLQAAGFAVSMTRETDTDASNLYPSGLSGRHKRDLQNRLTLIRQSRAVGVLSIHVNSSVNKADRGPIVFYAVNSESAKVLATRVQAAVNQVSGSTQRPLGRKNLFLLRHAPCAAVLVELGFITNPSDIARLQNPAYRQQMAVAIATVAADTLRSAPIPPPYIKKPSQDDWTPPRE